MVSAGAQEINVAGSSIATSPTSASSMSIETIA
jgi:hypothetical protein